MSKKSVTEPDSAATTQKKVAKVLVPGRTIKLSSAKDLSATVYPIGMGHLQRFTSEILTLVEKISRITLPQLTPEELAAASSPAAKVALTQAMEGKRTQIIMQTLAPTVITEGLKLVNECTVIEHEKWSLAKVEGKHELPHWDIAPIVEAWILENFGDDNRVRPWIVAIKNVVGTLKEIDLSELQPDAST